MFSLTSLDWVSIGVTFIVVYGYSLWESYRSNKTICTLQQGNLQLTSHLQSEQSKNSHHVRDIGIINSRLNELTTKYNQTVNHNRQLEFDLQTALSNHRNEVRILKTEYSSEIVDLREQLRNMRQVQFDDNIDRKSDSEDEKYEDEKEEKYEDEEDHNSDSDYEDETYINNQANSSSVKSDNKKTGVKKDPFKDWREHVISSGIPNGQLFKKDHRYKEILASFRIKQQAKKDGPAVQDPEILEEEKVADPVKFSHGLQFQYQKGILITGNTLKYKKELKDIGGSWNSILKGWIFRANDEDKIVTLLYHLEDDN